VTYAIAADGKRVATHFGRCEKYVLVDIDGGRESGRRVLSNPGHEPGLLPRLLSRHEVSYVVAGGAGPRAVGLLGELGIGVHIGVFGPVEDVIRQIAAGELPSGENACEH